MRKTYFPNLAPRTLFSGVLILCLTTQLSAQNLYVQPLDGSEQVSFELAQKPKITMSARVMKIEMPATTETYSLAEVQNLSFVKKTGTTEVAMNVGDKVRLYPNPVKDELELNVQIPVEGLKYQIYDLSGALVKADEVRAAITKINMESYPAGLYIFKLEQGGQEVQSFKIVKQ